MQESFNRLLESVYEAALAKEFRKRSLKVERQAPMPVVYEEVRLEEGFRVDLVVQDKVLVELKSVEKVAPVHKKAAFDLSQAGEHEIGAADKFWRGID